MCGRYMQQALQEDLIKHFSLVDGIDYFDIHGYKTRPEIFPGEPILAINNRNRPEDIWWTIEDKDNSGAPRRAINAKAETVTKVRMFADAFRTDRVLIPATGFFEWDANKQRYLFTFDEPIFAFGGLARDCQIKGEQKRCGVIMTTEANAVVRPIHVKPHARRHPQIRLRKMAQPRHPLPRPPPPNGSPAARRNARRKSGKPIRAKGTRQLV